MPLTDEQVKTATDTELTTQVLVDRTRPRRIACMVSIHRAGATWQAVVSGPDGVIGTADLQAVFPNADVEALIGRIVLAAAGAAT